MVDFGLAEFYSPSRAAAVTSTYAGSSDYMSPEGIKKGHISFASDFYSLGAVLYEMLTGYPPHYSENKVAMEFAALTKEIKFPEKLSKGCVDLLEGLLDKNSRTRLGAKGINEIKNHDWLKGVDWEKVKRKELVPPFTPDMFQPLHYCKNRATEKIDDGEAATKREEEEEDLGKMEDLVDNWLQDIENNSDTDEDEAVAVLPKRTLASTV